MRATPPGPLTAEALAASIVGQARRNWDLVAYCAHYGGGIDVRDWPRSEAVAFLRSLSDLVARENEPRPQPPMRPK